jgi:riboflavin kinase/FMN adenylyltransferase
MRHYRSLDNVFLENSWITIGSFDGIHRGHQEIIQRLTAGAHAEKFPAVVITFHPNPALVLGKRENPAYLTSPQERAFYLAELGVDVVITHPFNKQVASTSAYSFIKNLKLHLGMSHLLVGPDFALGRDREGDIPTLSKLGEQFGYQVEVMEPVKIDGEVVSSSRIRNALASGDIILATQLLGHPYLVEGEVIPGDGRGRVIGIPTANLNTWSERQLPTSGVYVCQAQINGITYGAVTNVGVRPTFESQSETPQVEAHILDFDQQIYGEHVSLAFLSRLRDEKKFPDIQSLVNQINLDIFRARETLSKREISG